MREKLNKLEEIMELDEGILSEDTVLSDIEEWDSISVLSFVAMLDDEYGKNINSKDIKKCNTVGDLLAMMEK